MTAQGRPIPSYEHDSHLANTTVQLSLSLGHAGQFPHSELEDLLLLLLLLDLGADDGALALAVDGLRLDLLQNLIARQLQPGKPQLTLRSVSSERLDMVSDGAERSSLHPRDRPCSVVPP